MITRLNRHFDRLTDPVGPVRIETSMELQFLSAFVVE
jgi:hypothetical protein